jgi:hypothetical protein
LIAYPCVHVDELHQVVVLLKRGIGVIHTMLQCRIIKIAVAVAKMMMRVAKMIILMMSDNRAVIMACVSTGEDDGVMVVSV